MEEENRTQLQQIAEKAFAETPGTYANGFVNGVGVTDTYVVFQVNGKSTIVVNMSVSMAKSLSLSLAGVVQRFENQTGQQVLSMEELTKLQSG